jgi:pantetheine-phosphate adenylyltransferase
LFEAYVRSLTSTTTMVNRKLNPDVDSVFLMTRWEYSYLSSSVVREVAKLGGDVTDLVPEAVRPVLEGAVQRSKK